jgi:hypothetical protein
MDEDTGKCCSKCGEWKPWDEFPPRPGRPLRASHCKACQREYQRRARQADPEHARRLRREAQRRYAATNAEYIQRQRDRYEQLRDAVFGHYGRVCACCGVTAGLSIDHPDGNGSAHRIELFGSRHAAGARMYAWLVAQGFPDGFQVLCLPCNKSKGKGAACRLQH